MGPSLSPNTPSFVSQRNMEARNRLFAAQRASLPLTFHPADGSVSLRAWALKEAGDGYWDIIVDNTSVEDGTPHRIFETRSRMVGPLDTDTRGMFSVGAPEDGARVSSGPIPYQRAAYGIRGVWSADAAWGRAAQIRAAQEGAVQAENAGKAKEEMLRLGALPGVASGVMENVAYDSSGTLRAAMHKDRPLVDALCARLAGYCGEGGRSEGAVETLDRLLVEVRAARQGPTSPPDRAVTLGEMCSGTDGSGDCEYKTGHVGPHSPGVPPSSPDGQRLNGLGMHRYQGIVQQLRAPGKMFSREKFLAILHAKQAECRSPRRMGLTPDGLIVLAELVDVVENLE
jgi:hypothetical protein